MPAGLATQAFQHIDLAGPGPVLAVGPERGPVDDLPAPSGQPDPRLHESVGELEFAVGVDHPAGVGPYPAAARVRPPDQAQVQCATRHGDVGRVVALQFPLAHRRGDPGASQPVDQSAVLSARPVNVPLNTRCHVPAGFSVGRTGTDVAGSAATGLRPGWLAQAGPGRAPGKPPAEKDQSRGDHGTTRRTVVFTHQDYRRSARPGTGTRAADPSGSSGEPPGGSRADRAEQEVVDDVRAARAGLLDAAADGPRRAVRRVRPSRAPAGRR